MPKPQTNDTRYKATITSQAGEFTVATTGNTRMVYMYLTGLNNRNKYNPDNNSEQVASYKGFYKKLAKARRSCMIGKTFTEIIAGLPTAMQEGGDDYSVEYTTEYNAHRID